jgi:TolB-like protein
MSVAVLSFQSRSRDSNDVFLAEGLADDIAERLSQVARIVVISREAVRRLPNANTLTMAELGRRLNAVYIVSGNMRPAGEGLRIVIELTRARSSEVAWSGPYDRTRDQLLGMQVEVASAIAGAVAGRLTGGEGRRVAAAPTQKSAAFTYITRGTAFMTQRVRDRAVAEFREAVRLDSTSALAWARLSQAYALCRSGGCPVDSDSALARLARQSANRALAIDTSLADSWLADGEALVQTDEFDLPAARASLEHAVRLDPRLVEAHHVLAYQLLRMGEEAASEREYRVALALDPGRSITWGHLAYLARAQGRFRDMEAAADTALALDASNGDARFWKWEAVTFSGDPARMRGQGARLGFDTVTTIPEEVLVGLAEGDSARANAAMDRVLAAGGRGLGVALLLVRCGRRAEAARLIGSMKGASQSAWLSARSPAYAPLHGIPEFDAYLERARARALQTARPR